MFPYLSMGLLAAQSCTCLEFSTLAGEDDNLHSECEGSATAVVVQPKGCLLFRSMSALDLQHWVMRTISALA